MKTPCWEQRKETVKHQTSLCRISSHENFLLICLRFAFQKKTAPVPVPESEEHRDNLPGSFSKDTDKPHHAATGKSRSYPRPDVPTPKVIFRQRIPLPETGVQPQESRGLLRDPQPMNSSFRKLPRKMSPPGDVMQRLVSSHALSVQNSAPAVPLSPPGVLTDHAKVSVISVVE